MTPRSCGGCRYWNPDGTRQTGECRIHPPVVHPLRPSDGVWPETAAGDWCGQHAYTDAAATAAWREGLRS